MPDNLVYLTLLFGWALPVIALHWIVGAPALLARWKVLLVAVSVPTVYLSLADAVAIGSGIWSISEELSVGLRAGSLVFEEALFFLLTNLLVAQSIVLFLAPSARARAGRLFRACLSGLPTGAGRKADDPAEPTDASTA